MDQVDLDLALMARMLGAAILALGVLLVPLTIVRTLGIGGDVNAPAALITSAALMIMGGLLVFMGTRGDHTPAGGTGPAPR